MSEKMDKKALKKKKKKKSMVMKSVILILLLVVLAVCIFFLTKTLKKDQAQGSTQKPDTEQSQDGADATDDTETGDDASRNSSKGGSGIGLSIVKKIMEDHGGQVWATSKEGTGTTMYLALRKYQEVPVHE